MKALVTGATGFIGSHLAEELVRNGYNVTCLVRKTSDLKWLEAVKVNLFHGDCIDADSLRSLPSDFDYVFHLAGLTKAKKEEDFFSANATGTENLLKAVSARMPALKRFIHLSSLAAAGPGKKGSPVTEVSEPSPVSVYGRSKLEGERAALKYRDSVSLTIIRPPAVYGPRDKDFYLFFKMIKRGFYPYWGKCYYSMLYVDDLVRGMIMAAREQRAEGGIYFLSGSRMYSNEEIVNEIKLALDARAIKVRIPKAVMSFLTELGLRLGSGASIINKDKLRELGYSHWVCDAKKAEAEFGFTPKVSLKEGIKWTADWYRIHQWL